MAHIPVLLNEVLEILEPKSGKVIVDGTLGGGGHAIPIIERLRPEGTFMGIDWDGSSRAKLATGQAVKYKSKLKRLILRTGNYADLPKILKEEKLGKIDGVFLDLGFSSEQLESGRGFSFMKDEPLIMTYSKERLPAYRVLKQLNQKEMEEIIRTYGEERYAKRIAKAIWEKERKEPITRSGELVAVIRRAVPSSYNRARINPATRTFMAFRIYVNDELGNLEKFLKAIPLVMAKKGRVAIISFHSLEDRTVKNRFRLLVKENKARLLTKKPIIPSKEEIRANPRSRSAKLRAIEFV
ncbi:MAG: 16S rRNA (cytosine(1402)-N(4))-methyltransferase RsmH [Candidatus Colwellbacteria bacterium]|nr:16S rRNA (cytosine(1402)-N(4))-methyltransferase RsmH [Candidatus Colwellbacteria bacterium]